MQDAPPPAYGRKGYRETTNRPSVQKEIDVDTRPFRKKYKKRHYGSNLFDQYPAGGADVIRLCDAVDRLTRIVREIQAERRFDDRRWCNPLLCV
jgi:hypothetical protein